MVVDAAWRVGRIWLLEAWGNSVSLINQVLKDVEARQGGSAADGWAGAQVKPVLYHPESASSSWLKPLLWGMLILGLALWIKSGWPEWSVYLSGKPATPTHHPVARATPAPVKALPPTVEIPPPATLGHQPLDAQPQLTRTLFSEWQNTRAEPAGKQQDKIAPEAATRRPSAKAATLPQIEGEFSIKPAEGGNSATVLSVIEPPADAAALVKNKENVASSAPEARGVVNKQLRPDQEANVLIQRAVDHEQKGRMNEALSTLRQALELSPSSEDARQLLAAYLFEGKQDAEAVSVLQTGIKRYPEQGGLARSLAKWQLSHGQPEAVLATLKPVANALMQDAESQWMLAMASQQLGQHQAALPYFERAITLRPGQAQTMVAYALSLQASGQNAQALQQLQLVQSLALSERMAEFVSQRIRQLGGTPQSRNE